MTGVWILCPSNPVAPASVAHGAQEAVEERHVLIIAGTGMVNDLLPWKWRDRLGLPFVLVGDMCIDAVSRMRFPESDEVAETKGGVLRQL